MSLRAHVKIQICTCHFHEEDLLSLTFVTHSLAIRWIIQLSVKPCHYTFIIFTSFKIKHNHTHFQTDLTVMIKALIHFGSIFSDFVKRIQFDVNFLLLFFFKSQTNLPALFSLNELFCIIHRFNMCMGIVEHGL